MTATPTLPARGLGTLSSLEKIGLCAGCLKGGIVAAASYFTPLGRSPKKVHKVRRRKNKQTGLYEEGLEILVNATLPFCRSCRTAIPVRLPHLKLKRVSPTRVQRWQQCPEGDLRDHDWILKSRNHPPVERFLGDLVHKCVNAYAKRGSSSRDSRQTQVAEKVGAAFADPMVVGQVPNELKGRAESVTTYVHLMLEYLIEHGLVRKLKQWRQLGRTSLILVDSELRFNVPLSWLVRHFLGPIGAASFRYDAMVNGSVDLFRYYSLYPGYLGPVVIINDYKTFWPEEKDRQLEILDAYRKSLQLMTYALWASWAFEVPLGNVVMQPIFVVIGKHEQPIYHFSAAHQVRLGQIEETLRQLESYAGFLHQVEADKPNSKMQGEKLLPFYPARRNPGCPRCPAWKICTLTAEPTTDDPRSNIPKVEEAVKFEQLRLL